MRLPRPLILICGVRPQYIKAAALVDELTRYCGARPENLYVVDTGQHYDPKLAYELQLDIQLSPHIRIEHGTETAATQILGNSIVRIGQFLSPMREEKPVVVVFGDANPSLAGAASASILGLDLVHVEAGARRDPSEIEHRNSKMVDSIATLKFCVTNRAFACLADENLEQGAIVSGDVASDWMFRRLSSNNLVKNTPYVLASIHRKSNQNVKRLARLFDCFGNIASRNFKFLVHPALNSILAQTMVPQNVEVLPPQLYSNTLNLIASSDAVFTDSGGLAREAVLLKKPTIMLRDKGGWPELAESGHLKRVSPADSNLIQRILDALEEWPRVGETSPLTVENGTRQMLVKIMDLLEDTE